MFSLKLKKEQKKKCQAPKNSKNSSHNKRYKKGIEKGSKMKSEKYKKSLTTTIKFFTLFCTWKKI